MFLRLPDYFSLCDCEQKMKIVVLILPVCVCVCVCVYTDNASSQNVLDDRLKHANSGVVLGTISLFLHFTQDLPDLHQDVYGRIHSEPSTLSHTTHPSQLHSTHTVTYTTLPHTSLTHYTPSQLHSSHTTHPEPHSSHITHPHSSTPYTSHTLTAPLLTHHTLSQLHSSHSLVLARLSWPTPACSTSSCLWLGNLTFGPRTIRTSTAATTTPRT